MTNDPNQDGDHDIEPLEVPGPEEVPYPPVLRLTSVPDDEHHEDPSTVRSAGKRVRLFHT